MSDAPDAKPGKEANKPSPDGATIPSVDERTRLNDLVGADDYEAGAEEVQKDTEQGVEKPSAPKSTS